MPDNNIFQGGLILETWLLYLLMGGVSGLLAGLFGIGGGLVLIPALVFAFAAAGLPEAVRMQLVIGTSLATITLTSLVSAWSHHRHGAVQWPYFVRLAPGMVLGTGLGAALAHRLPSASLQGIFAVLTLVLALRVAFFNRMPDATGTTAPTRAWLLAAGLLLGLLPGLAGIGGGLVLVPFLLWRGLTPGQAVGTSAACMPPIGLAGALAYGVMGQSVTGLPAGSLGYVYLPAMLAMAAGSMLLAPLGARLAHRLPRHWLRRGFALLMAIVGVLMLVEG